jgi:hypothetical protein
VVGTGSPTMAPGGLGQVLLELDSTCSTSTMHDLGLSPTGDAVPGAGAGTVCTRTAWSDEFDKRLMSLRRSEQRLNELLSTAEAEVTK